MFGIFKNFKFAFKGIKKAWKEGPIIKIIVFLDIIALTYSYIMSFSAIKWAIVILGITLSIVIEMFNSALEYAIDATKIVNKKMEIAKDIGSGAVLFFGIMSILIAIVLSI